MRGSLRQLLLALALILPGAPVFAAESPFPKAVEAEIDAAKESMVGDQAEALRHAVAIDRLARGIADPRQRALGLATARWLAAEAHLRSDAPDKAAPLLADGLRLIQPVQEPIKLRGDLLMSQGALYMAQERAVQALENYQAAFRVFGAVKEPRSQAIALQNIGVLYSVANDDVRAEQYYRQAAELYDGDPVLSFTLRNNRGNVLATLDRYAEAEKEYGAALTIAREMDKPRLEAIVLSNLARSQINLGHLDAANRSIVRGFALSNDAASEMLRRQLFATAAKLAATRNDYATALHYMRKAFAGVDLEQSSGDFRNPHLYAYQIYAKVGDTRRALAHLEALRRLNDQAAKVATTTGAALMAARFNYAEQQARIQTLKAQEERRTAEFQRTLFLSIGGATLVVIAALAWGLVTVRRSRDKVKAANIVLADTNVALEKALKAKTEFLATTSHEIRTPLNGILGMTQVMLSDARVDAQMRDRIGIVHSAGVQMRALVDDILDMAKMETGHMTVDMAPMDLCATLREVTRLWEEQAAGKGLGFRLELSHAPRWIVSDSGRLRQVVFNLLSNAIKFTAKGSVTLRAVGEGDGDARRLRLVVADTGIGIPKDKYEDIFESFRQVDTSTTRRFGGTGLGLAICRNLAQALGGDIRVESEEGRGSTFTVDLPWITAEAPEPATETGGNTASMVILDRNPIARSMLKTLFEPRVAALRFAGTAEEALALLGEGGVSHLLADEATLKAGSDNPMEIFRKLCEAAPGAACSVLWLKPDAEIRSQLQDAGARAIIEKPVAGTTLVDAIIPPAEENSGKSGSDPLVSRAA